MTSIDGAKAAILEDISAGRVPPSVATFSELHDYIDANCYVLESGPRANDMIRALNRWLVSGRPTTPIECLACHGVGHPADADGNRSACDRCGGGGWEPVTARMLRIAHVARMAKNPPLPTTKDSS